MLPVLANKRVHKTINSGFPVGGMTHRLGCQSLDSLPVNQRSWACQGKSAGHRPTS